MKILENEHQRQVRCQRVQRLADFSEHPLARGAEHFAAQQLAIGGADQGGHLQQPHWRMRSQDVDDFLVLSAQSADSFENREVGFTRAVLLQTLASRNAYGSIGSDVAGKSIYQGSLTNARFSG